MSGTWCVSSPWAVEPAAAVTGRYGSGRSRSGGQLYDAAAEGIHAVGQTEACTPGGGGDPLRVILRRRYRACRVASAVVLGADDAADHEVLEHRGPACLDGSSLGVEHEEMTVVRCRAGGVEHEPETTFMDHLVVAAAEQGEPFDIRGASLWPGDDVMVIEMLGLVAAGEAAGGVAQAQSAPLSSGGQAL